MWGLDLRRSDLYEPASHWGAGSLPATSWPSWWPPLYKAEYLNSATDSALLFPADPGLIWKV